MNPARQHISRLFFVISFCIVCSVISAQTTITQPSSKQDKGFSLSAAFAIPIGKFSSTHLIGVAAEISPSAHTVSLLKQPKIGFTYNGGVAYYLGKKETVSLYPYKYPGFIFIHAFAGAICILKKGLDIKLTGGPALGIHNGNLNFNIGSKLDLNYHFNNTISIGPGINMMKEFGATSLWSASIKTTIAF